MPAAREPGVPAELAKIFSVSTDVFERFPDYIVGWVIARNVRNVRAVDAIVTHLSEAEDRARLLHAGKDLKEDLGIAVWRSAFSTLGWSASKYPASVESILKRVSRGESLPRINPAVDVANAAALLYLVPVGCHDLDTAGNLQVRLTLPGDCYLPMGDAAPEPPQPGEIVYASGTRVRTRRWVWRQSRDALVGSDATTLLFPVDGFSNVTGSRVEAATEFLAGMCRAHLSDEVAMGYISRDSPATS